MAEVREFGRKNRISKLTKAKWNAEETDGWEMTGIAAKVLQAKGAYRTPNEVVFMVFTQIGWAPAK
jgi:hypothetical protein